MVLCGGVVDKENANVVKLTRHNGKRAECYCQPPSGRDRILRKQTSLTLLVGSRGACALPAEAKVGRDVRSLRMAIAGG